MDLATKWEVYKEKVAKEGIPEKEYSQEELAEIMFQTTGKKVV